MPSQFSFFFRGFHPRYVWKDNKVGGEREYIGEGDENLEIWMQLFLDLLYVCMVSKLTHEIVYCSPSPALFIFTFSILYIFYLSRFLIDEFCMRFAQDDIFHRLFYFVYTLGTLIMVLNSDMFRSVGKHEGKSYLFSESCNVDHVYFSGFSYGFYITRGSIFALYFVTMKFDESGRAYYQFFHRMIFLLIDVALFLWSDLATESANVKAGFIFAISAFEICGTVLGVAITKLKRSGIIKTQFFQYHFPANHLIVQARMGQFVMLVLGESMISLLNTATHISGDVYVIAIFGLLLIYMLAMHYYDQVQKFEGETHAFQRDMLAGLLWVLLHPALAFCLLLISAGLVAAVLDSERAQLRAETTTLLALGSGLAVVCMTTQRITHKGLQYRLSSWNKALHLLVHLSVAGAHLSMLASTMPPRLNVLVHALLATASVCFDIACNLAKGDGTTLCHRGRCPAVTNTHQFLYSFGDSIRDKIKSVSSRSFQKKLRDHEKQGKDNNINEMEMSMTNNREKNQEEGDRQEVRAEDDDVEEVGVKGEETPHQHEDEVQLHLDDNGEYYCLL